jgi:hypothetical protein
MVTGAFGAQLQENALRSIERLVQPPGRLARFVLLRCALCCKPMLHARKSGQEERSLLRCFWGFLRLVALLFKRSERTASKISWSAHLDHVEIQECLPPGAREQGQCQQFGVQLVRCREEICCRPIELHSCQCIESCIYDQPSTRVLVGAKTNHRPREVLA